MIQGLMKGGQMAGRLLTGGSTYAKAMPVSTGLAGAATAGFVGQDVVSPIADSLTVDYLGRDLRMEAARRQVAMADRARADRMRKATMQNAMLLAQMRPDLAAQLLAGRRLPRGGVVFGGQPRMDLLAEAGRMMGEPQAQTPQQALAELMMEG